jgi:hypothetical protein
MRLAPPYHVVEVMLAISTRAHAFMEFIPQVEIDFTTSLIMGKHSVELPGRYSPLEALTALELIVLPDLRIYIQVDYVIVPCKHECVILKQSQHVRQAREVWKEGTIIQRALMLSRAEQFNIDTAKTSITDVVDVGTMDRLYGCSYMDLSESPLYSASVLNLHGLPHDFDMRSD